jgi:DNA invertase Pin-like site-specific DNA recombinase
MYKPDHSFSIPLGGEVTMSKTNERPSRREADMQPRAILYLRQSTFREESISLELQETAGRDHAKKHGYQVIGVEADPGISGRTWKRPAVLRVMEAIDTGAADVVVLWRWSRLSRSRKDWALAVDRVETAGGRIESATEPNDITASGRFARGVMTELAAFESERIGEQWKEVHAHRLAKGLPTTGVPWGWRLTDGQVMPHPEQAPAIATLYDLYAAGAGGPQLGRWLTDNGYTPPRGPNWTPHAAIRILDSPIHSGQVTSHGNVTEGAHDGLVSVETFKKYRALRAERATRKVVESRYLLSGLLHCQCGMRMYGVSVGTGRYTNNPYFAYRCLGAGSVAEHGVKHIQTKVVDPVVFSWLEGIAVGGDPTGGADDESDHRAAQKLARQLIVIDGQMSRLTQQFIGGIVPERAYTVTMADLQRSYESLEVSMRAAESRVTLRPPKPANAGQTLVDAWPTASGQTKRAGLRALVQSMVIDLSGAKTITITTRWGSVETKEL